MISKYVLYLLLFVVSSLCLTGGLCADEPKAAATVEEKAAAAAKAAADEAAATAAAAVEIAVKAAVKAENAAAAAAKAVAAAKAAATVAAAAKKPDAQVEKALGQIKNSITAHQLLDNSLNAAWLAAKALPGTKKAKEIALKAAVDAAAAIDKVQKQLTPKVAEDEKKKLEQDLKDKQQEYATARNLLEIADSAHQRRMSDLKKALELAKSSHKAAIDQAAKMEELLTTIVGEKSDAKKSDSTQSADSGKTTSTSFSPNPRVRSMNPPSTNFKHIDAFQKLPFVKELTAARDLSQFSGNGTDAGGDGEASNEFVCDYRFDRPAHFHLPEFGLGGETIDNFGLIIYEGMQLAVKGDGRYQLRFVVATPAVPVDITLQLVLEDSDNFERYTLTLPRISIPGQGHPKHSSQRRETQLDYQDVQVIHHEGFLPVLAQKPTTIRVVRRSGTARFGFGVDVP